MGLAGGPVASIGVDAWGVDYGLLDPHGTLLSDPHCYRSGRTSGWRAVAARLGEARLYKMTGTQLMPINTIFQLAAHDRSELENSAHLLMMAELMVHHLTGAILGEVTSAGTSGMLDVRNRRWSDELAAEVLTDPMLLPELVPAGTPAGFWRGTPVHLVAGHDTASAVLALDCRPDSAFLCTGTWFLAGRQLAEPDTSATARTSNFSNEPDAVSGVRLLKNLTGLVLLERLHQQWGSPSVAGLAEAAARLAAGPVVDVDDPGLVDSDDLDGELRRRANLPKDAGHPDVVRVLIDSLAARVAVTVENLGSVTGWRPEELVVGGGGTRIAALTERLAAVTGLPVRVGPAEAAATGNALVQEMALEGRVGDRALGGRAADRAKPAGRGSG